MVRVAQIVFIQSLVTAVVSAAVASHASKLEFNRDIRPILSDTCFLCHGPDQNKRKADLRLDIREDAVKDLGGYAAIVPGNPDASEIIRRIFTSDADDAMPPPESHLRLSPQEKSILRQWVAEGADYQPHWAFMAPVKAPFPLDDEKKSTTGPIDAFILDKLNKAGLQPADPADQERLLRRVTMDLTGLPPTIEEIDRFLNDLSTSAYETVVDRLLQTDAHAERLALDWMDLARYADSHGMHADGWRMMWPWRDWVIKAFKNNMPYDEFVTWQLAGDLMPNATHEQILATAFHRNHPMTAEGGVIDEEFRLHYVFDRTQTTGTAFLGLTFECARCHDHKFDPISQENYYQFSAFFNNVKELGMTGDDGNYGPMLMMPSAEQEAHLHKIEKQLAAAQSHLHAAKQQASAEATLGEILNELKAFAPPEPTAAFPLDEILTVKDDKGKTSRHIDGNPDASPQGNPSIVTGRIGNAIRFDNEYDMVSLNKVGLFETTGRFSATVWIHPASSGKNQSILATAGNKNTFWRGWEFHLDQANHLSLRLIHALPHNYIHVRTDQTIPTHQWSQIGFSYDGSSQAHGVSLFINGQSADAIIEFDQLYKSILPVKNDPDRKRDERAVRVGKSYRGFTGENGIFKGLVDQINIYDATLSKLEMASHYSREAHPDKTWSLESAPITQILDHYLNRHPSVLEAMRALEGLRSQRLELINQIPEIMVMEEMPSPRTTYILKRGQYDLPQKAVSPGMAESILPFPNDLPKNRLGLAQWLFLSDNPLTARVTVNRYWQMFFGKGLVETTEDFGSQGSRPSHPQLLDWIAVEFMESGWNVRHLVRMMVHSKTYQQSSRITPEKLEKDPTNRLLSRGPSYRLPAEHIRDNALAASGLLSRTVGGPSVKPYQPDGLWIDKGNFSQKLLHYKADEGDALYRRSLYTFIRRTSPHPAMQIFDAPNRDICTVRRETTNTPLQALVLMNDPQFVESAKALAERVQKEQDGNIENQIDHGFRLLTGRHPNTRESVILRRHFQEELIRYRNSDSAVAELLSIGEYKIDATLDAARTAALTMVMNTLMNYDEFYMKR